MLTGATTGHRLVLFPSLGLLPCRRVQVQGPQVRQNQFVSCCKRPEKSKFSREHQDLPLPKSLSAARRTFMIQTPPPAPKLQNRISNPTKPSDNQQFQPTQSQASCRGCAEAPPGGDGRRDLCWLTVVERAVPALSIPACCVGGFVTHRWVFSVLVSGSAPGDSPACCVS